MTKRLSTKKGTALQNGKKEKTKIEFNGSTFTPSTHPEMFQQIKQWQELEVKKDNKIAEMGETVSGLQLDDYYKFLLEVVDTINDYNKNAHAGVFYEAISFMTIPYTTNFKEKKREFKNDVNRFWGYCFYEWFSTYKVLSLKNRIAEIDLSCNWQIEDERVEEDDLTIMKNLLNNIRKAIDHFVVVDEIENSIEELKDSIRKELAKHIDISKENFKNYFKVKIAEGLEIIVFIKDDEIPQSQRTKWYSDKIFGYAEKSASDAAKVELNKMKEKFEKSFQEA